MVSAIRLFILFGISFCLSQAAHAKSCAVPKIVSGKTCKDIVIEFKLKDCGEKSGKAKIQCTEPGTVIATLQRKKAIYTLELKEGPESWGVKPLMIAGEIEVTPLGTSKKKAKTRKIAEASSTSSAKTENPTASPSSPHSEETPATTASATSVSAATPAPVAPIADSGLSFNGLVDVFYAVNFAKVATTSYVNGYLPYPQNRFRTNDLYSNSVGLNMAELSVKRKGKEVNFKLDLDFGQLADWIAGPSVSSTPPVLTEEVTKHIGQANISWTPAAAPNLTVTAGKVLTFIGYEVPKSKENWNYSRSMLFQLAIPVWHVGLNAVYQVVPGKVSVGAHVYNGWNNIISINSGKTLGLQIGLTPNDAITWNFGMLSGPLNANDNSNRTTLYNSNFQWTASPTFSLAWDLVMATWGAHPLTGVDSSWYAFETLAKWNLSSGFYLSPRFEVILDDQGAITGSYPGTPSAIHQILMGGTLTASLAIAEGLETRLEGRVDTSTAAVFPTANGLTASQTTGSFSFLYSF